MITIVSMVGIGIGAMALVVVLSAFNGIENLVDKLYSSFDPDIRIEPHQGKTFSWSEFPKTKVLELNAVEFVSRSIEETVLIKHRDAQYFVTLKGVDEEYLRKSGIDSMLFDGEMLLYRDSVPQCILGYGVAQQLDVYVDHFFEPIHVYAARREAKGRLSVDNAFKTAPIYTSGIFAINPEFDFKYALVPYHFAADVLQHEGQVSSVEVGVSEDAQIDYVKGLIQELLGPDYLVKTRFEINELLYKTNATEKWITFLILSFILVIAAFNMIGSLTMLIIDKKRDLGVMSAMGMSGSTIESVFLLEGILISIVGGFFGIILGLALCFLQLEVGLLKLQEGTIAEYYPIAVEFLDLLAIIAVVILIGFVSSWFPAKLVARKYAFQNLNS